MVNGNSLVLCQPNTRTFEEIKALIKLRIINCNNIKIINHLMEILTSKELDADSIYAKLKEKFESIDIKKELSDFIESTQSSNKQFLSKIKIKADSLNPEISKNIEEIQKNTIVNKLKNDDLINNLQFEKRIVLIIDNYTVHRSTLVKKACKYLNIKFIYLPTNSPHLNPIEQVWKSIKKYMSHFYLDNENYMKELFEKEYYWIVDNVSFYKNWLIKFIPNICL